MQLLGQTVIHRCFGEGMITDVSGKIVAVHFAEEEKKFLYPEAFSNFLTLKNETMQKEINEKYHQRLRAEVEKRENEREERERRRQISTMKITQNAQAAFHVMRKDDERVIEIGSVSTGCYLSGHAKGEPRIPSRLKPNSACLLTELEKGGKEKDRRILGAFMVKEDFCGERCRDGMIEGHEKYRIGVPTNASLLYWDYFQHDETFPAWGKVAFKYLSNSTMQKILLDMTILFTGTEQEAAANEFYRYFCSINRLPIEQK